MSMARLVLEYHDSSCRTTTQDEESIVAEFHENYSACFQYGRPLNHHRLDRHLPVELRPDPIRGDRMRYSTRYATRAFQELGGYRTRLRGTIQNVCNHVRTSCRGLRPERTTPLIGEMYCFAEHYATLTARIGDLVAELEGKALDHPILQAVRDEWEDMLFEGTW